MEKVDYKKIVEQAKLDFEKVIEQLKEEFLKIRLSRASPSLIENVLVEIFEKKFPLKQLGTISTSAQREIKIEAWDVSYVQPIIKALEKLNLGAISVTERKIIISLSPVTEEFKKEILKMISQKKERAKRQIREIRESALKKIQRGFREGQISEDEKFKGKKELQNLVEKANEKIEEIFDKKKREIEI